MNSNAHQRSPVTHDRVITVNKNENDAETLMMYIITRVDSINKNFIAFNMYSCLQTHSHIRQRSV